MAHFDNRIREQIRHAYEHAPAIRQLMDGAGLTPADIQTTADLSRIPITRKDELVEIHRSNPPFGGFLTIDPDDLERIFISPGPIFDPQPPVNREAATAPFRYVGFGRGDRVLNTFTYQLTPAGLLIDEMLRSCGATVLPTGPGNTELQILMVTKLHATGFVGQPSYLMTILDKCLDMGMGPGQVPLKKALFSAEPYTPSQRARFESEYGMKTTSAYGTADLGIIGYTCEGVEGFRLLSDLIYIQIADPDSGEEVAPGEIGEIVATTFNPAYPLIRFGTGDLGALSPELLDGKNQHLLGLFGRSGDAIKVRGMFLHPNQLKAAVAQFPQIKHLQAIVTRPENTDVVTINIELKEGAAPNGLAEKLKQLAQQAVRLRIDQINFVEPGVIDPAQRIVIDRRKWD